MDQKSQLYPKLESVLFKARVIKALKNMKGKDEKYQRKTMIEEQGCIFEKSLVPEGMRTSARKLTCLIIITLPILGQSLNAETLS